MATILNFNRAVQCSFLAALMLVLASVRAADTNGFAVKFTSADEKISDTLVVPNLWLYAEGGQAATPFLPPGKFTAVFEGSINGDLRANYIFKAEELSGALKLEINGKTVLDATAPNALSESVQINKGANAVRATFTSAGNGDSALRVGWTEKGTNVNPIPNGIITHTVTPELQQAETVYLGRELFLENRCAKCHTEKFTSPVPELAMDAPSFDGIGARRNFEWMAKWILNPKSTRASVRMPKLLHGPKAKEDAEAVADYLSSLTNIVMHQTQIKVVDIKYIVTDFDKAEIEIRKRSGVHAKVASGDGNEQPADQNQESKPIFERLHCISCHNAPDKSEADPAKISLKHVTQKFSGGKLAEFLRWPEDHFAWIRMPNFKLADAEAKELAEFLLKQADKVVPQAIDRKSNIARGRDLVQSAGCLNCHTAWNVENKFAVPSLTKLAKEPKGCLAE